MNQPKPLEDYAMNALVNASANQPVTMSSLELVEFINSQRKEGEAVVRHSDFLAKVLKVLGSEYSENFRSTYIAENGKQNPCYVFPKREACLMAMSYSYDLQAVVYDRMTELENRQVLPTNYIEALEHLLIAKKSEQQAIAERDHAIATKAHIGSKREATAMANTAAANRKLKALENQLDQARDYASVKKVESITKRKFEWKPLKHWSIDNGVEVKKAFDANFPKGVNTYSSSAWLAVHNVDIHALECAK